jgi:hypothetical protein
MQLVKQKMATYTNAEYADIRFIYSSVAANHLLLQGNTQLRLPERRQPDGRVIPAGHRNLRETGKLMRAAYVGPDRRDADNEENVLVAVYGNPSNSTRRITPRTDIPRSTAWRVLQPYSQGTATGVCNCVAGYCIKSWMILTF